MSKGLYINDSIHGLIQLSEYEKRIISSIGYNRLHDVYQNSTVYLTFPSNRTKRFEHSLGTMKLASDMFYSGILNSSIETLISFYDKITDSIDKIIISIKHDYKICEDKLFGNSKNISFSDLKIEMNKIQNSLIPSNVPEKYRKVHCIIMEAIRVSALLHDIGHPPFSHIIENALKKVYEKYSSRKNDNEEIKKFCSLMSKYFKNQKQLHEQMGDEITKTILDKITPNVQNVEYDEDRYNKNLYEIIIGKCILKIFSDEEDIFEKLHLIIDGSLDCDRLDYVTRDSINSGMNSGKIEYERIISDMKLIIKKNQFNFCIPKKAINSVEDFLKRRIAIYKNIIYHHRVIKTDSLLQFSVEMLIDNFLNKSMLQVKKESESKSKVKSVTENMSSSVIPYDISGLWYPLGDNSGVTLTEKETALSQWNDSWLMTILKQIYYSDYYQKSFKKNSQDYILYKQLTELLCNTKSYFSVIKRIENFIAIDNKFSETLKNKSYIINSLLDQIKKLSNSQAQSKQVEKKVNKADLDILATITAIKYLIDFDSKKTSLLLRYLFKNKDAIPISEIEFQNIIEQSIKESVSEIFTNGEFSDIMVVHKIMKKGLNKPIYFYSPQDDEISTLDDISGIQEILEMEIEFFPMFYVYILTNDEIKFVENKQRLLFKIGEKIGENFSKMIINRLKKIIQNMEDKNV